jgi:hypothetical protein
MGMRQLLSDIALIPDNYDRGVTFERAVKRLLENRPETRHQFKLSMIPTASSNEQRKTLGPQLGRHGIADRHLTVLARSANLVLIPRRWVVATHGRTKPRVVN